MVGEGMDEADMTLYEYLIETVPIMSRLLIPPEYLSDEIIKKTQKILSEMQSELLQEQIIQNNDFRLAYLSALESLNLFGRSVNEEVQNWTIEQVKILEDSICSQSLHEPVTY